MSAEGAEAEEVAGDGVGVGFGVLGGEPPGAEDFGAGGWRGAEGELRSEEEGEIGESFGEPEAEEVAAEVLDGGRRVVV